MDLKINNFFSDWWERSDVGVEPMIQEREVRLKIVWNSLRPKTSLEVKRET